MIHIPITESDLALAVNIASARNGIKVNNSIKSRKASPTLSEMSAHLVGLYGEIAWSRHTGQPVDMSVGLGGDRGWDFITEQGNRVDIKSRMGAGKDLILFPRDFPLAADVIVLCWVTGKIPSVSVSFVGWASRELIERNKRKVTNKLGERIIVRHGSMVKFHESWG